MKKVVGFLLILFFGWNLFAQVDTSYIYNTHTDFGTLDIRITKSETRFYYLQENKTFSFRESAPGVRTNTYLDMTSSWDSSPYTEGNLRERNGNFDYFTMNYRLLFPKNYDTSHSAGYPIIIIMQGAGERGNCWENKCYHADRTWKPNTNLPAAPAEASSMLLNNDHNLMQAGKAHLDARNRAGSRLPDDPTLPATAFPGFVLVPQNLNGWDASSVQDAIRLLRLVLQKYNIDKNRVYIHGLSNGGAGVYEAIKRAPWLFAAALSMSAISDAGIISQNQLQNIAHIPLWIFQGGQDINPTLAKTEGYVRKFKNGGAIVRYTLYPNLGHGTWNTAYREPDFFQWILSKNKSNLHAYGGNSTICLTSEQGVRLELAQGFRAYQWEYNGVIIDDAVHAVYEANVPGAYRARFSRVPNPTEADWNSWSQTVMVAQQEPQQPVVEQVGTLLLKDLNNYAQARLKAPDGYAHYYWYKDGTLMDFAGSEDDTVRFPIFKGGDCTGECTGNGSYTLVTAGYDNCPSLPSEAKQVIFNNQAPLSITAPENFAGQILSLTSARLTWTDASSDETGFEIWRRQVLEPGKYCLWRMLDLTRADVESFIDEALKPSSTYHYKIRAVAQSARSNYAPLASTSYLVINTEADAIEPSTPQNLTATTAAMRSVKLTWDASTDNSGIGQYRIRYQAHTEAAAREVTTGPDQTSYILKDLDLNTLYTFSITAEDLGKNLSGESNSVTFSTQMTGLYYEHSTGAWTDLDDIDWSRPAEFTGTVPNFTLSPRQQDDYFNFKFEGYLYIKTPGDYNFCVNSSDGVRLELDDTRILDWNGLHQEPPGAHNFCSKTHIPRAGPKHIVVKYFEYTGDEYLTVRYKGPDTDMHMIPIPDEMLTSGATLLVETDTEPPSVPQNFAGTLATAMRSAKLSWNASTDSSGIKQYRIYYKGHSEATGREILVGPNETSYLLTDLDLNTAYTFTVRAEDLGENFSAESNPITVTTHMTGLYYEHSLGTWTNLDEIDWSKPAEVTGSASNFTLSPRKQDDYFNFKFEGYLNIKTPGNYGFCISSSDGSRVELDGIEVLHRNDSRVPYSTPIWNCTTRIIDAGGPKHIVVKYFENIGDEYLTIQYMGPDTGDEWVNIPDEALTTGAPPILDTNMETAETPMEVTVFPNPTSQHNIGFKVITKNISPLQVRVIDLMGQEYYRGEFNAHEVTEGVRIAPEVFMADGIYLLLVEQAGDTQRKSVWITNE
ncbi:MAG: fibronectin type III domain-containing protein [Bacteroidota bacterium]